MRISDLTIERILERGGTATPEQIDILKKEAVSSGKTLRELIVSNGMMDEKTLTKAYAAYVDIPYVDLDPRDIPYEVLTKIPERIAKQYNVILFKIDDTGLMHLAMDDPDDVQAVSFIQKEIGALYLVRP